jgi:hypothetical protein
MLRARYFYTCIYNFEVPRRITRALKCFHGSRVVRAAARIQMLKTKQDALRRFISAHQTSAES